MSFSAQYSVETPETTCIRPVKKSVGSHVFKIMGYSLDKNAMPEVKSFDMPEAISIDSAIFTVGGYDWFIRYYPNGSNAPDNFISAFLHLKTNTTKNVKAQYTLTVLNENESPLLSSVTTELKTFNSHSNYWGSSKFVEKTQLESHIKNDCFIIKCTLTVLQISQVATPAHITVPPGNILQQLGNLLEDGIGADVTFQVDGQSFNAHRCILAARSPVFLAQFFGSLKEKPGTIIQIEEIEATVFKSLLHYIYYDSIPGFKDKNGSEEEQDTKLMAKQLLLAADKYSLDRLKIICEKILCGGIEKSNVVAMLFLAERHGCNHLNTACLKFLASPEFSNNLSN